MRAELVQIAERFEAADRRAKRAATLEEREAAGLERQEAAGDFWAAEWDLTELLLLLIRLALRHQPDVLAQYLREALREELEALADAVIKMEARR
jgi:hypothetical protein